MKLFSERNAPSSTFFNQDQDTGTTPTSGHDKLHESQGASDKQNPNVASTDPSTVTIPPAEGRTDIGAEQSNQAPGNQAPGATTATTQPEMLSKQPSEGRSDVAEDLEKEQRDAYSAHHPTPSSQGGKRSKTRKKKK